MKISKSGSIQYTLIYILLLSFSSVLKMSYPNFNYFVLIVAGGVIFIIYRRIPHSFWYITVLFSCFIIFLRVANSGGTGIGYLASVLSVFFISYAAVYYDVGNFLRRYINTIMFFTVLSIGFWLVCNAIPSAAPRLFIARTNPGFNATYYGNLFYSFRSHDFTRNSGIFSEPGIYQMVLISALFFLLFYSEELGYSAKVIYRRALIIIFAIITTQSTSGYISLFVMLLVYFFQRNDSNNSLIKRIKTTVICGGIIVTLFLVYNYIATGNDSVLSSVVINKIFDESGKIDLNVSTGASRNATLEVSIALISRNPFGVGYETYNRYVESMNWIGYATGGGLFNTFAILGVPQTIMIYVWYYYYARKNMVDLRLVFIFTLIFLNFGYTQGIWAAPLVVMMIYPRGFNLERSYYANIMAS